MMEVIQQVMRRFNEREETVACMNHPVRESENRKSNWITNKESAGRVIIGFCVPELGEGGNKFRKEHFLVIEAKARKG